MQLRLEIPANCTKARRYTDSERAMGEGDKLNKTKQLPKCVRQRERETVGEREQHNKIEASERVLCAECGVNWSIGGIGHRALACRYARVSEWLGCNG